MKNRIILLTVLVLALILGTGAIASDLTQTQKADTLNQLGMFAGTDKGYELERGMTRVEAAVMLARQLGVEDEAKKSTFKHPFIDVPKWADPIIGYMYKNNLVKGTSATTYGSSSLISAQEYMTLMLRSLKYDDTKGDFKWNESLQKSAHVGVINSDDVVKFLESKSFTRGNAVEVTYNTILTEIKDTDITLVDYLSEELGVIDINKVKELGLYQYNYISLEELNLTKDKVYGNSTRSIYYEDDNYEVTMIKYVITLKNKSTGQSRVLSNRTGQFLVHEGVLYYNYYETGEGVLKKISLDGTGEKTLGGTQVGPIFALDNYIYYVSYVYNKSGKADLNRINLNTLKEEFVMLINGNPGTIDSNGKEIYAIDDKGKINRIATTKIEKLDTKVHSTWLIALENGVAYSGSRRRAVRYMENGSEKIIIKGFNVREFVIVNESMYFIDDSFNDNKSVKKINIAEGLKSEKNIFIENARYINIYGEIMIIEDSENNQYKYNINTGSLDPVS